MTNLLGIVANVLPSTSTNAEIEDSSKSNEKPAGANPSGIRRGRKPYPILSMPMATKFDQRKKIKKLVKNKRNQNNNLAKNFL